MITRGLILYLSRTQDREAEAMLTHVSQVLGALGHQVVRLEGQARESGGPAMAEAAMNLIRDADAIVAFAGFGWPLDWLEASALLSTTELAREAHAQISALGKPFWLFRLSPEFPVSQDHGPWSDVRSEFWAHFIQPEMRYREVHDSTELLNRLLDLCHEFMPGVDRAAAAPPTVNTTETRLPPSAREIITTDPPAPAPEGPPVYYDPSGGALEPVPQFPPAAPENRAFDDNVQFTVFQPGLITPHQWSDFIAYAHLSDKRPDAPTHEPDPKKEVERRARAALGATYDEYDRLRQNSRVAFPRDGEITFAPEAAGAEFNPRSLTFLWTESVHEARFRVRAKINLSRDSRLLGRMNVYLGPLLVGSVELGMKVSQEIPAAEPTAASRPTVAATAATYRNIFASYSHNDTEIVRACQHYAASLGDRLIRDQDFLRGGQDWRTEIGRAIGRADVFQLFWSPHSAASREVRWEVQQALAQPKQNFVRPTYWDETMPAPWNDDPDISKLHFERMPFSGMPQAALPPPPAPPVEEKPCFPGSGFPDPPSSGGPSPQSPASGISRWTAILAALLLIGGAALLIWHWISL